METGSAQTCVLAGASRPAGLVFARLILARGWNLVAIEGRPRNLQRLEASLRREPVRAEGRALFMHSDLRNGGWLKLAARRVREQFGEVHRIIAVADFARPAGFSRLSLHQFRLHLDHNVFGPAALVHAFLPVCASAASVLLLDGAPGADSLSKAGKVAIDASMAGLEGLAMSLRAELPGWRVSFARVGDGLSVDEASALLPGS